MALGFVGGAPEVVMEVVIVRKKIVSGGVKFKKGEEGDRVGVAWGRSGHGSGVAASHGGHWSYATD